MTSLVALSVKTFLDGGSVFGDFFSDVVSGTIMESASDQNGSKFQLYEHPTGAKISKQGSR